MKRSRQFYPDASRQRRRAGAYLGVSGNRLLLSLSSIVLLSVVMIYVMLYYAFAGISEYLLSMGDVQFDHTGYVTAYFAFFVYLWLTLLLTLFLTFPLFCGLFYMASRIVSGRETALVDLFHSFSSGALYWRAIRLTFRSFLRILILSHAIVLTYEYAIAASAGRVGLVLVGAFVILCEIALTLLLSTRDFFRIYVAYTYPSMPIDALNRMVRDMAKTCKRAPYRFAVDFLPWLLLSFATAGILLIADTLPRLSLSYFLYCGEMEQRNYQSEDIKDHE